MDQTERPAWLEGWQPAPPKAKPEPRPRTGSPAWTPGMRSPNPLGRPKGIVDRRVRAAQRMIADAEGIVEAMVAKALEGDTGAASLVLGRVLPSLRSQTDKVCFPFDSDAPISAQVAQVLDAVAAGAVAPDVGRLIIESVKALADVRATEELEQRITLLEARQV